jgi:hypothetical protein
MLLCTVGAGIAFVIALVLFDRWSPYGFVPLVLIWLMLYPIPWVFDRVLRLHTWLRPDLGEASPTDAYLDLDDAQRETVDRSLRHFDAARVREWRWRLCGC